MHNVQRETTRPSYRVPSERERDRIERASLVSFSVSSHTSFFIGYYLLLLAVEFSISNLLADEFPCRGSDRTLITIVPRTRLPWSLHQFARFLSNELARLSFASSQEICIACLFVCFLTSLRFRIPARSYAIEAVIFVSLRGVASNLVFIVQKYRSRLRESRAVLKLNCIIISQSTRENAGS